jgi:hypothetical protein
MKTPSQVREAIKAGREALEAAFDKRDFEGCGIIQNGLDELEQELRDFQEDEGYEPSPVEFEPVEKPYRELPDGPEGYGSYESRFEDWYAEQNQ